MKIFNAALFFSVALISLSAHAQQPATLTPADTSAQPLEISADNALEWDRVNKKYVARGNAIAKQKDFEVKADTLVADYREGKDKKTEIYRLTATGNVI